VGALEVSGGPLGALLALGDEVGDALGVALRLGDGEGLGDGAGVGRTGVAAA